MTARLTDDQLRELLELEAKATPGTWRYQGAGGIQIDGTRDSYQIEGENHEDRYIARLFATSTGRQARRHDATLIAAARNAIRPLVEELLEARKLLSEVAELRLDPDLVRRVEEALK